MRARASPCLVRVAMAIAIAAVGAVAGADEPIFSDGFESGDLSRWSSAHPPPTPTVRLTTDAVTVSEGSTEVTLFVELKNGGLDDVDVDWEAVGGTATAGSDFVAASGTVTLNTVENSVPIVVPLMVDELPEGDEQFAVHLTSVVGAVAGSPKIAVITIVDDDEPSYVFLDSNFFAAEEDVGAVDLTVRLDPASEGEVTVRLTSAGGSAVPGVDYSPVDQLVVFAAGETSHVVSVEVTDDSTYELTERFGVVLTSATGSGELGDPIAATVEIDASDSPPGVFLAVGLEGDSRYVASESIGEIVVPVRLSEPSGVAATVRIDTVDDQAVAGVDYGAVSTTLVFGPGQAERLVAIPIFADGVAETVEDFDIILSDPVGCVFDFNGPYDGKVDIFDSRELAFTLDSVSVAEGAGTVELDVVLSETSDSGVEFDWRTSAGSAMAGEDFSELVDSTRIEQGELEASISIPLNDDSIAEADETFSVTIFFSENAAIAEPKRVTVEIVDDDEEAIQFDWPSYTVGESEGMATLTVVLNEIQDHDVSVDWSATHGSAQFGLDYSTSAGTVTVPAGESSADFQISIIDDPDQEADETIQVALSDVVGVALGEPSTVSLTILDNDRLAVVSFSSDAYTVLETDSAVELAIMLNEVRGSPVVVQMDTADVTAVAADDYVAVSEAITIPADESAVVLAVPLIADGEDEGNETFSATLSAPEGAELGTPRSAIVEIVDDASLPQIRILPEFSSVNEDVWSFALDVVLDVAPEYEVQVRVNTVDGEAVGGVDFLPVDRVLTFPPGVTNRSVYVDIFDDLSYEPDESFSVRLSEPSAARLGNPSEATVTILGGDWPPFVYLADGGDYEAEYNAFEQHQSVVIPVRLSQPSGFVAEVDFTAAGGTATAGEDYESVSRTLVFEPGQVEKLVHIEIYPDGVLEGIEDFNIALSDPVECGLDHYLPDTGVVTVRDDLWVEFAEPELVVSESAVSVKVYVNMSATSEQSVNVYYTTDDGTATSGEDYTGIASYLWFTPGATTRYLQVLITQDSDAEGDETFTVSLTDTSGLPIEGPSTATVTILDDDVPEVAISPASISAGEGDGQVLVGVSLSFASSTDVSVDYATADGTAVAGLDYNGTSETLLIPAGETSGHIPVSILDDELMEGKELFSISLGNAQGAAVRSGGTAMISIIDDELRAVIGEPDGRVYGDGDVLTMDGSWSVFPPDYSFWFAVLRDDGSDPMDVVQLATGLTDTFTTSEADPAYRVRLVAAAPGWMPDDGALRGAVLPCVNPDPATVCVSDEVVIERADLNTFPFTTSYVFPDAVLLVWGGSSTPSMELERSSDGGKTWTAFSEPGNQDGDGAQEIYTSFADRTVAPGMTYHYRIKWNTFSEWFYLGNSVKPPGDPVVTPVWTAPRPVPSVESVIWDCPDGASRFMCYGTLTMSLNPEPGESLGGTTISLFLNETTFEAIDGRGEDVPIIWPATFPFSGRDEPGCVERKSTPDLVVEVPEGQDAVTVDVPNVHYGANSFRFVVEGPEGGYSERALLYGIHDEVGEHRAVHDQLLPLLFGTTASVEDFQLNGLGPVGIRSPDCADGDWRKPSTWVDEGNIYTAEVYWYHATAGMIETEVGTDEFGEWTATLQLMDGVDHIIRMLKIYTCHPEVTGHIGRSILAGDKSAITTTETAQEVCADYSPVDVDPIHVDTSLEGLHPPTLDVVPGSLFSLSDDEVVVLPLRFRIADLHHDVDVNSVTITNESFDPPEVVYGFYAEDQLDRDHGDWGWFVAEVPAYLPSGETAFDNSLRFQAADHTGNVLDETVSVTRDKPLVWAEIGPPEPPEAEPRQLVIFDGTGSIVPGLGAGGGVARWLFFRHPYNGPGWEVHRDSGFLVGPEDLVIHAPMPETSSMKARLIVAASMDDFPANPWSDELPCLWNEGDGRCDAKEVVVDMVDNDCYQQPTTIGIRMVSPVAPDPDPQGLIPILQFNRFEPIQLEADTTTGLSPIAYRWVLYDADDIQLEWPLAYLGGGEIGWSVDNAALTVTAAGQGLAAGDYRLVVEGRHPVAGCSDPAPGWYFGRSTALVVRFGHTFDGVAPGRVVEGGTFRVYSRSWSEGEVSYVLVDDDLSDEVEPLVYEGVVQPGGYLEVNPDPVDLPAMGSRWLVSVAPSADGAGRSIWWDGLAVEPPGDPASPLQVTNEEDTSCGGVGTECAHPIIPGQAWSGEWGAPGDEDYFSFLAGAGTELRVTVRSLATDVPPAHPAAPAPEVFVVRPDGIAFAASGPPSPEGEVAVDATLTIDGRYLVVARTSKGVGIYVVTLDRTAEEGSGPSTFGWTGGRVHLTTEGRPEARLRVPLLDPFGNPIAGAGVTWEEGTPCVPEGFCGTGITVDTRSTIDGYAALDTEPSPGVAALWRPAGPPVESKKTLDEQSVARIHMAEARRAEAVLGSVTMSGKAVAGSELSEISVARALIADRKRRLTEGGSSFTEDGPMCGGHSLTCSSDDAPIFHTVRLDLAPGEELIDIEVRILRNDEPTDRVDAQVVLTEVPLAVEAIAMVRPTVGDPRLEFIEGPIGVSVAGESGGALTDGDATCDVLAVPAGPVTFKTGRDAVHRFLYFDENGDSCCWAPTELLTASVVIRVDVDDGQGSAITVTKEAQALVPSSPRPADPCSLRFFETDVPRYSSYVDYNAVDLGDVYLTDSCGNVIVGLGRDDSPFHDQPGDEFRIVSPVGPIPGGVWATATSSSNQWSYDLFLNGDPALTENFIPDGGYSIDFGIAGLDLECASGGVSHTVNTQSGDPQVVLWWDWDWDSENSQRGWDPDESHIPVASALRDRSGGVAVWRVPASDDGSLDHSFGGDFNDVPVKLYVASYGSIPVDADGNIDDSYLEPVDGVVLCTGVVERLADGDGRIHFNSEVRTTCDTEWNTWTVALASSDPEYEGESPAGPPNSWVPMGLGVGIVRGPEQPGHYVLVAEPLDPTFRRSDAWRVRSSLVPDSFKDFFVDSPPDVAENDFTCGDRCEDCAGGDIGLRNGNVRHTDADPIAGLPVPLSGRTYDSLNTETGVFGLGWFSAFDARAEAAAVGAKRSEVALQSAASETVRITTEDNRTFVFRAEAGADFIQGWPEGGVRNRLVAAGSGYVLELAGDPYRRTYRASDGKLTALTEIATGRGFTIIYDGDAPSEVIDSWRGSIASFSVVDGLVNEVATSLGTVGFEYGGDTALDAVAASGATWRTYGYSGENLLTEVFDGAGYVVETYGYADGLAASSVSAGDSITGVEWGADGPRPPIIGERVVRTDSAAGASAYYYLRWIAGKYRVVEIVGECACSGNDRAYAYDRLGHLVLEQDGRGYISRREYLGDGRVSLTEAGLRPVSCDPADFPDDPSICRLTVDELEGLEAVDVVPTDAYQVQWYAYDDPSWPNRPTQVCHPSVLQLPGETDRVACTSTTYDPVTGQWMTSTESGWTGQSAFEAAFQAHTTTRTFYGGSFTAPAFDPGGAFDPAWLVVTQPENLVRSTDGPRTDVTDVVQFVYYPVVEVLEAPVPIEWRGRLAAQMDSLGHITRFEDYDKWGNARRIVGPTGITTELTCDDLGRVLTRTLVGGEGCNPVDDQLCTTDLVTTSTYEPGGGPLESVTSPGGAVTEYAYDDFGRLLTTDRGPAPGAMGERTENEYDPVTGLRVRDSRLAFEAGTGWVEYSRTDYEHYLTGQLVLVERPRFEDDPAPSEEHYAYDVAGRIATVQDPNHTAPNVEYIYDPLGRLERVRQLLDPTAPADEQWAETNYGYDSNGNLVAVTDANGNLTEYLVDDFGQTVRITSPVTGVTEMVYDAGGNLVIRLDGRDVMATSVYDANGRLTGITYDDGVTSEELSFFYDAAGRRTGAETPEVTQAFTHSRRGLVLTASHGIAGTVHEASYAYDLDGQLESVTYPSGRTVSFARDFAGRPTAINSVAPGAGAPVTVAENLEYLPFGPARSLELGPPTGRLTETRGHDWHYRRTAQQLADTLPTALLDLEYDYDAAGNLVTVTDYLGDRSAGYGYDDLGRLTGVTWADANRVFEYDAIGNLERIGVDEGLAGEGEVLLGYLGNPEGNNSPVLASTQTSQGGAPLSSHAVASDDVGNVTSDGLTTLDYNLENHLNDRDLKGVTLDYTYSADGRLARFERSDTGVATEIVLDIAGRRLAKLEGGVWRDYVYLGDQLLAYFDDGGAEPVQVIADRIGMPMTAIDGSGAVVWEAKAEPYGELRGEVGLSADPGLRYPGQWQDELDLEATCVADTCTMPGPLEDSFSLFENGYRWYKPGWGRYGQGDPIGGEQSLHQLDYVQNSIAYGLGNPVRFFDRFGLQSEGNTEKECCDCPGGNWRFSWTTFGGSGAFIRSRIEFWGDLVCKSDNSVVVPFELLCKGWGAHIAIEVQYDIGKFMPAVAGKKCIDEIFDNKFKIVGLEALFLGISFDADLDDASLSVGFPFSVGFYGATCEFTEPD